LSFSSQGTVRQHLDEVTSAVSGETGTVTEQEIHQLDEPGVELTSSIMKEEDGLIQCEEEL
jgi:hypothetical protein